MTAAPRWRTAAGRPLLAAIALLSLAGAPRSVGAAGAETDYLPDNGGWNGLSALAQVAANRGNTVELVDEVDWNALAEDPGAVLLLVYPRVPLPTQKLITLLERGGRLLIADDFGSASPLLAALGIRREQDGSAIHAQHLHDDNPSLPIALADTAGHALTDRVRWFVTNHPAFFRSRLPTLAGFDNGDQQVLLAGQVGRGRFVALSDPSVLINTMQRFRGNVRLVENLIAFLARPQRDHIYLLTGVFRFRGDLPPPGERAGVRRLAGEFNGFVGRVNDFALTEAGMRALAFICGTLALAGLVLLLPRPRTRFDGHWTRPAQARPGAPPNATWGAAVMREEIEERLTRLLDAPGPVSALHPDWLVTRVRERAGDEAAAVCGRLLTALRPVPYATRIEDVAIAGRVSRRELATIYQQSERLLRLLGDDAKLAPVGRRERR